MPRPPRHDRTADVVVHLGARPRVARTVRAWCDTHAAALGRSGVLARTDPAALHRAVPGLDLRSDHGRRQLRDYLAPDAADRRAVLWSTDAVLGPAYLHTGGRLHPFAGAGIAGVAAATRGDDGGPTRPARRHVALTIAPHAEVVTDAWVRAVRLGHAVPAHEFVDSLTPRPSWVPLVRRLVRDLGPDDVTVHPATRPPAAAARQLLADTLALLAPDHRAASLPLPDGGRAEAGEGADIDADGRWSRRAVTVALAALPHLRSEAEREALSRFVDRSLEDPGGPPAVPLTSARADDLAALDEADLATIRTLVEVR